MLLPRLYCKDQGRAVSTRPYVISSQNIKKIDRRTGQHTSNRIITAAPPVVVVVYTVPMTSGSGSGDGDAPDAVPCAPGLTGPRHRLCNSKRQCRPGGRSLTSLVKMAPLIILCCYSFFSLNYLICEAYKPVYLRLRTNP